MGLEGLWCWNWENFTQQQQQQLSSAHIVCVYWSRVYMFSAPRMAVLCVQRCCSVYLGSNQPFEFEWLSVHHLSNHQHPWWWLCCKKQPARSAAVTAAKCSDQPVAFKVTSVPFLPHSDAHFDLQHVVFPASTCRICIELNILANTAAGEFSD